MISCFRTFVLRDKNFSDFAGLGRVSFTFYKFIKDPVAKNKI